MSSIAIDPSLWIPSSLRSETITLASSRATSQRITSPIGLLGGPLEIDQVADGGRLPRAARERARSGRPGTTIRRWTTPASVTAVLTDYHLHLRPDEPGTEAEKDFTEENVERYLEAAEAAGIDELGVSEHIYRFPTRWRSGATRSGRSRRATTSPPTASSCARLRCGSGSRRTSSPGREDRIANLLDAHDFDYVVGSVHFMGDDGRRPRRLRRLGGDGDPRALWRRYFERIAEAARSGLFDILAHPDLVKIWGKDRPLPEARPALLLRAGGRGDRRDRHRGRGLDRGAAQARRRAVPLAGASPRCASTPAPRSRSPPTRTCPSRSASATTRRWSSCDDLGVRRSRVRGPRA